MPHRSRAVAVLAAAALAGAFSACDGGIAGPEPTLTIEPASLDLEVGASATLHATVTGLSDTRVTWASGDAAVASVEQNGAVTGRAPGVTNITVRAVADPRVEAVASVIVRPAEDTVGGALVTITQMLSVRSDGTTAPLVADDVRGEVRVVLNVRQGRADRLEVLVGDQVVDHCTEHYETGGAPASAQTAASCTFDSAEFRIEGDAGIPVYANAEYRITARLMRGAETLDATRSGAFRFRNADRLQLTIAAADTAVSAAGEVWHGGDIAVRATPISYSGIALDAVGIVLFDGQQELGRRTLASPPFRATFSAAAPPAHGGPGGVADVESRNLYAAATSATAAGAGPTATTVRPGEPFRLDNRAPEPGTFVLAAQDLSSFPGGRLCCAGSWVGGQYSFADGKSGQRDSGVGLPSANAVRFHVGAANLTDAQLMALPHVQTGAALAETHTNTAYRAIAVVRDRLGNAATVRVEPNARNPSLVEIGGVSYAVFGVDRTPPTAAFIETSAPNMAINPDGPFQVRGTDPAGAGATASGVVEVLSRLDRWAPGLTPEQRCVTPGTWHAGTSSCRFGLPGSIEVPGAHGYYTFEAFAVDYAGNVSGTIGRVAMRDGTPPHAGEIALPATLTGGVNTTWTSTVSDELNLWRARFQLSFGAGGSMPFTDWTFINDRFPGTLVTTHLASATFPFVRALELTRTTHAPVGTAHAATEIQLSVYDAAANPFVRTTPFPAATVPAGTSFSTRGLQTFRVTAPGSPQQVTNSVPGGGSAACPAGTAGSRTITAQAVGPAGTFSNPFARVYLYRIDAAGETHLIGSTAVGSAAEADATRVWTYNISFDATALPAQTRVPLFAVGVHGDGDALRTQDNTNITICSQP
jgi:hypothetical protein